MKENFIEVDDGDHLLILCGTNDSNIKGIGRLLKEKILLKGNKLILDTENKQKIESFKGFTDTLLNYISEHQKLDTNIIKALYESHFGDSRDVVKDNFILFPNGKKILPKTLNQTRYIKNMLENEITFAIGPAGTGKTFLAVAFALQEILRGRAERLLLTRPVVESGENLGFLPGDLTQKIAPYLIPLYDSIRSLLPPDLVQKFEENSIIEVAPLAYMRGRSIDKSIIILDEAQNTTKGQMKMFLTRLGFGSRVIISGDITQIDLPKDHNSGLIDAEKKLKKVNGIGFSYFSDKDVVRNPLVKRIIKAYDSSNS